MAAENDGRTTRAKVRSSKTYQSCRRDAETGCRDNAIDGDEFCAEINNWNDAQCCEQLAVSLRGRAQRIYLSLQDGEKPTFDLMVKALQAKIQPEQQRKVHKLSFSARRRKNGEGRGDRGFGNQPETTCCLGISKH